MNGGNSLEEEHLWIDSSGTRHEIATMDLRHCRNVHDYLMRNAHRIVNGLYTSVAFDVPPSGEVALDAFDAMVDELADATADPCAYLARQPLLQALERRLGGGPHGTRSQMRTVKIEIELQAPEGATLGAVERSVTDALADLPYDYKVTATEERR
jgi:hypothetical protein